MRLQSFSHLLFWNWFIHISYDGLLQVNQPHICEYVLLMWMHYLVVAIDHEDSKNVKKGDSSCFWFVSRHIKDSAKRSSWWMWYNLHVAKCIRPNDVIIMMSKPSLKSNNQILFRDQLQHKCVYSIVIYHHLIQLDHALNIWYNRRVETGRPIKSCRKAKKNAEKRTIWRSWRGFGQAISSYFNIQKNIEDWCPIIYKDNKLICSTQTYFRHFYGFLFLIYIH